MFVDRGCGCLAHMNETQCFGVEFLAIDVAADRDE